MEESDLENLNQRSDLYQPRSNKWKQMEEFCSRNLQDSQYSLVEKVWLILSRTDGECGQLLGQAVIDQYDGIRAWVVSYILWGAFSVRSSSSSTQYNNSSLSNLPRDVTLPPSRSDITRTIAELKYSLSQSLNQPVPFPSSDSSTPSISVTTAPYPPPSSHHAITDDEGDGGDGVNDSSHYYFILLALEIFQLKQQEIKNRNYKCLQSLSLPWPVGEGPPIGKLITVHSGHNGWPNHHELEQFTAFLSEISFQSDSR